MQVNVDLCIFAHIKLFNIQYISYMDKEEYKEELKCVVKEALKEAFKEFRAEADTMSMSQVCGYLHLQRGAVYDRIKAKKLNPKHSGRRLLFLRSEVEALVK